MIGLTLHDLHSKLGASFIEVNGMEAVASFGDPILEYAALRNSAGLLDLSCRSRLCVAGADRKRFLHGQVTNNVKDLEAGQGCYAALTTAKGKMESDLNIFCLQDELLLDFEPGYSLGIIARLEKYVIADDVQVIDAAPHYGLLSVQGPKAGSIVTNAGLGLELPARLLSFTSASQSRAREEAEPINIYCMNHPRGKTLGFDLFIPQSLLATAFQKLLAATGVEGGRPCGWQALETLRIERGIPRFGADK